MEIPEINLAIADDHDLLRKGLCVLLGEYGFNVSLQAANGKEMIDQLQACEILPDVCLLDINMPVMNGVIATRLIKEQWPNMPIIAFSLSINESEINEIIANGADVFINKASLSDDLQSAIMQLYSSRKHVAIA